MTYFKLLLIVGLSVLLNHCDKTGEVTPEQTEAQSAALQSADCIKGVYKGELDTNSGFWMSVTEGIGNMGDNADVTVSVAHNDRPKDLLVIFLIESERGNFCSSYGGPSYEGVSDTWHDFVFTRHTLSFSSGSSSGSIGTRGSIVPVIEYFSNKKNLDICSLQFLEISDVSNSALKLENENTSGMRLNRTGEVNFNDIKVKCEQVSKRTAKVVNQDEATSN